MKDCILKYFQYLFTEKARVIAIREATLPFRYIGFESNLLLPVRK